MKNTNYSVVLEPSTNTHTLQSKKEIETVSSNETVSVFKVNEGVVLHGEHGPIGVNSGLVIKYNQNEYNPVTRQMQKAFD
jgi:hypothetical protein